VGKAAAEQCSLCVISLVAHSLVAEQRIAVHFPVYKVNLAFVATVVALQKVPAMQVVA